MIVWKPLQQTERSHCLEVCVSAIAGRDEPYVLTGERFGCRWLELQTRLRSDYKMQLSRFPLNVEAQSDKPRFGGRAWVAFVTDPDSGRRHAVIAQRDEHGALRIVHDGARDIPAPRYQVSHLVNFEQAPGLILEPLDAEGRCENGYRECVWLGY